MNSKILVIDDAPDAIMLAAKHLSDFGEVLATTVSDRGLDVARKSLPEVILLDLQMPGMNGYEILAELKSDANTSDIPVIIITADTRPESESGLLECGAADFIAKPINPSVLRARVSKELNLLQHRRMIEQSNRLLEQNVEHRTAQLNLAKEAAEAASRAKSNFLGNMSHEMRTPLHHILGLVSLLQRNQQDEKVVEKLNQVSGAASHLSELIEGVLTVTQLESKSLVVNVGSIDVRAIVGEVLEHAAFKANRKNINLETNIDTPDALLGDKRLMLMALECYVNNAVTYTQHGKVTVHASLEPGKDGKLLLKITVEDTGPGISEEQQKRLFRMFEQSDNSSTRRFGGTGLGLYLVRSLAIEMGGDAGCTSVPGEGSRFWFTMNCL